MNMETNRCKVSLNSCIHSRRCFMTGEYCSQLANIHKARNRLHKIPEKNASQSIKDGEINAFVIMNFSNMSDVAYKWRLCPFIESLVKYFFFEGEELICCSNQQEIDAMEQKMHQSRAENESIVRRVSKINVIRADSNYDSNYVICNRVCQQIQMADLIVVDVSSENNNVFYEFGMAVALGKLILPICFSESFFQIKYPKSLLKYEHKNDPFKKPNEIEKIKRHIDCYPWRRTLFEYYGLRYRSKDDSEEMDQHSDKIEDKEGLPVSQTSTTQYIDFENATDSKYGFSDIQYSRFPYAELHDNTDYIGKQIYTRLGNSYNTARYNHNTLIIYTMDGFQNEEQAGACIANFYKYMTQQLQMEQCFCGDRVGILVESSKIPEYAKDAKKKRHLMYGVGDIIHLGMNEATYAAQRELIKTNDYLTIPSKDSNTTVEELDSLVIFTKNHIRNKSITIYPKMPIYVKRIKYGLQNNLLDISDNSDLNHYFCYFHVMLRTLKYVNQLVVDISKNSLESLFWLGAAHGSDINAITVKHEESEQERIILTGSPEKRERAIFDVGGLWSALLQSDDTQGFYLQLELAQKGIEQRSKLMLPNREKYKEQLENYLYGDTSEVILASIDDKNTEEEKEQATADDKNTEEEKDKAATADDKNAEERKNEATASRIMEIIKLKKDNENLALESYYRDRFWKPMLRNEHLRIYYHQVDGKDSTTGEPKVSVGKWDIDAISILSHYLSVRTHVGEHSFVSLQTDKPDTAYMGSNFISIGNDAKPLHRDGDKYKGIPLADHILEKYNLKDKIHIYSRITQCKSSTECPNDVTIQFQGFCNINHFFYSQIPCFNCLSCMEKTCNKDIQKIPKIEYLEFNQQKLSNAQDLNSSDKIRDVLETQFDKTCYIKSTGKHHLQVAQLILWREVDRKNRRIWYQVSMNGASGPATKALSSLVISDRHRKEVFAINNNINSKMGQNTQTLPENPLINLQEKVRKEFSEKFMNKLDENLRSIFIIKYDNPSETVQSEMQEKLSNKVKEYTSRFKNAALLYLSSVLYRHFLPFLSLEDEHRLTNGMQYFLASLFASNTIQIKLDRDIPEHEKNIKNIQSSMILCAIHTFESVIQNFYGVEALYQVDVLSEFISQNNHTDSRSCAGIELLRTNNSDSKDLKPVCCLFMDNNSELEIKP